MSTVTIRRANPLDVDFIVASNQAMATETEDLGLDPAVLRQGITYLMQHPAEGFYLVAEQAREQLGTLMVTFEWSDWRNGRFWWIQSVYVAHANRRRGIYTALHNKVREMAQQDPQACGIRLYVEHHNSPAKQTYQHLGMHETHYRLYEELLTRRDGTGGKS